MNLNRLKWLGFGGLLLMLLALGWVIVPAHVTSIWMDCEFTDWITPIANRLHDGARLYADGMHSPMPPIPFVLLRVLHPEGAIWIQESFLNYFFECASVLLLFFVFGRKVGPGLAFAACMGTIPVFLTFGKTILYDSMSHFLVVVCAFCCATLVESFTTANNAPAWKKLRWPALLGVALGLLLLTKQSTGVGATAGICLALAFLPATLPFKYRCRNIVVVGLVSAATVVVASLAMSRYMSFSGMVQDVFLAGSEPKGGNRRIFNNFVRYGFSVSKIMAVAAVVFGVISAVIRRKWNWRALAADWETGLNCSPDAKAMTARVQSRAMLLAILTGVACALAIYFLPEKSGLGAVISSVAAAQVKSFILNLGLAAGLSLAAVVIIRSLIRRPGRLSSHPLAPYVMIFFFAALFHNLSITAFRWVSDSNAFIALAQVFILGILMGSLKTGDGGRPRCAVIGTALFVVCIAFMWAGFFNQLKLVQRCMVAWPEIPHLAGAKMRPECERLRQLVKVVQAQADKSRHDTVLMLPDDPNVEAWIDRDRPAVSSSILFTDQYWDRYVDADFASLKAHPPKVIIIGPRDFWRKFSQIWHWRKEEGVIRLIDRVQNELLPANYDLYDAHQITFGNGEEILDVYVRRAP